jgi:hypothetical protein
MTGGAGNEDLLFTIGVGALRSVNHLETYFAVQHRHPDGERWSTSPTSRVVPTLRTQ